MRERPTIANKGCSEIDAGAFVPRYPGYVNRIALENADKHDGDPPCNDRATDHPRPNPEFPAGEDA